MDDQQILREIQALVEEERTLRARAADGDVPDESHVRLGALEVALDQAWDLLRQRRAAREFGEDPDAAKPRDPAIVEEYEQ
jgi:hypothetical protein